MRKNIKTIVAVTIANQVAEVRINDVIGEGYLGTDSATVRSMVDDALFANIQEAVVYLNSKGGSVFEATEIANILGQFEKVTIRVGALAASAATYLTSKFYTVAQSNSQFMFHRPMIRTSGDIDQLKSDLKLLENITDDYIATYAAKSGKSKEAIEEMLAKGDTWMTAEEAKNQGFIDDVESDNSITATAGDIAVLTAMGAPRIPQESKKSLKPNKVNKMERILLVAATLGLAADATDTEIQERISELIDKEKGFDALQAQVTAQQKEQIDSLINTAIRQKKIDAKEKEVYAKLAKTDFANTKRILEALQPIPQLSGQLEGTGKGASDKHTDWTLEDYMEKDPKALDQLYKEDPEGAKQLEAAYFN